LTLLLYFEGEFKMANNHYERRNSDDSDIRNKKESLKYCPEHGYYYGDDPHEKRHEECSCRDGCDGRDGHHYLQWVLLSR
jgi:hypothetical protein